MRKQLLVRSLTLSLALTVASAQNAREASAGPSTVSASSTVQSNSVSGAAIVQKALAYLGYRYTTVGNSPTTGFSCIGFVSYVFGANGIALPDDLDSAKAYAPPVPFSSLLPGDVLFFQNTVWPGLSHTAIYLGAGRFIHAEYYNRGVVVSAFNRDPVDGNYWIAKYLGANRPWQGVAGISIVPPDPVRSEPNSVTAAVPPSSQPPVRSGVVTVPATAATPIATPKPHQVTVALPVPWARVRSAPSLQASVVTIITQGQRVVVRARSHGWVQVRLADGRTGWLSQALLEPPPAEAIVPPASVSTSTMPPSSNALVIVPAHVHAAPSVTAPVLSTVVAGTHVQVRAQNSNWTQVRLPSGMSGYMLSIYLRQVTGRSGSSGITAAP